MKLAISNIAWTADDDARAQIVLRDMGVSGLEVAPTRAWPRPAEVSNSDVEVYRQRAEAAGFEIVAMQALLFGRDDLTIFESEAKREETLSYLSAVFVLAGTLGARALVFGSPRNRRTGGLPRREVEGIAVPFFRAAADAAAQCGTTLCLEANPVEYGCDFLTTSAQCIELLETVDSEGLALHLDTAAMTMAGEHTGDAIRAAAPWLRHFHISEPQLAPVGSGGVNHQAFAAALASVGYSGWLSIEMRAPRTGDPAPLIREAVRASMAAYGPDFAV